LVARAIALRIEIAGARLEKCLGVLGALAASKSVSPLHRSTEAPLVQ
jgi:hypothetical protein